MRNVQFVVFFTIVLSVYSLLCWLLYSRGMLIFPAGTQGRIYFRIIFFFLAASYIAARFLEKIWLSAFSDVLTWIGSFWLAAFFYFLMAALVIDILRLANFIVPFFPEIVNTQCFRLWLFKGVVGVVSVLLITGFINSLLPRIETLDITINKKVEGLDLVKIAFVSDIHMGTIIGPRRTNSIVNRINALNPDLILLGGDVVDEDLAPVIRNNLGDSLLKLKAPLGIIGITGNHEYIGGADKAVQYLEAHGIKMLRDTSILIDDKFFIIGREDRDRPRFSGRNRKDMEQLVANIDKSRPLILLDHQPFELDIKESLGIDLTLSGHTHHGQMLPLNYITKAIYEVSWGYKKKGNTHVYVSSGVGGWGPPVRIGNRPEIVLINLHFAN
jgi:predicted MPP superfamily phosphohydrolase